MSLCHDFNSPPSRPPAHERPAPASRMTRICGDSRRLPQHDSRQPPSDNPGAIQDHATVVKRLEAEWITLE